jgi:vesicle-fusing ATPase
MLHGGCMKSERGKPVTLVTNAGRSLIDRKPNYIYVSPSQKINSPAPIIKLKPVNISKAEQVTPLTLFFPVLYDASLAKDQIFISTDIRRLLNVELNQSVLCGLDAIEDKEWVNVKEMTFTIQNMQGGLLRDEVHAEDLSEAVMSALMPSKIHYPLQVGQVLIIPFRQIRLQLCVQSLKITSESIQPDINQFAYLNDLTEIHFINEKSHYFKLIGEHIPHQENENQLEDIPLDFVSKGIGGLKEEMLKVIRSALLTRIMKPALLEAYGVKKHAMGMLLEGPPGSGKTLIAKCIASLFSKDAVTFVEGPQLKSSYYGATQQNLADLFINARRNPDKPHVIIFDEIDVVFPVRGSDSSVSTSNSNDLTSRMLSILDGPDSPKNVFIIGTTNRKQAIDTAILRAGRMGLHLQINFPDERGRLEILQIHTRDMRQMLSSDVDLVEIAHLTRNYSGAELAMLVDYARNYAIEKNYQAADNILRLRAEIKSVKDAEMVSQKYFIRALAEIKPQSGFDEFLSKSQKSEFIYYDPTLNLIRNLFAKHIETLRYGKTINQLNFLISGPGATGKTSLALTLAKEFKFGNIQLLNVEKLLPYHLQRQLEIIDELFANIRASSEPCVVILDGLEEMLEAAPENHRLRMKLESVLKAASVGDNQVLMIATSRNSNFLNRYGLLDYFHEHTELTKIRLEASDPLYCARVLAALCQKVGYKINNNIKAEDNYSIEIATGDLLYQLQKYIADERHVSELLLGDFLQSLQAKYRSPALDASNENLVSTPRISLFRK